MLVVVLLVVVLLSEGALGCHLAAVRFACDSVRCAESGAPFMTAPTSTTCPYRR